MNSRFSSMFSLQKTIFALFVFWIGFSPMIVPVVSVATSTANTNKVAISVSSVSTVNSVYAEEPIKQKSQAGGGANLDAAFDCGITDFYCGLVKLTVFMLTVIPNTIAALIGTIADYSINFSIGYGIYELAQDIAFSTWKMVRDISNIVIILAIFVAAFGFILGSNGAETLGKLGDPKKIVMKTILVALLINFSFFFCRVIIDAGNLSARLLYNQIGVENLSLMSVIAGGDISGGTDKNESGIKSISLAMLNNIQAQKLLSTLEDSNGNPISLVNTEGFDTSTAYLILGFVTFLLDLVLISIFFTVTVLFLGRIVVLLLYTILSPLAMASIPIDIWKKDKNLGWDAWVKQMFGNAFLGVAFLFFVYLSIIFTEIKIPLETSTTLGGSLAMLIKILAIMGIKLAFMFFIIFKGKAIAVEWSGVVGEYMAGAIKTASGFAIGAATGGTALLARQTIGAAGAKVNNSQWMKDYQKRGGIGASFIKKTADKTSSASFDVANSSSIMGIFNQATEKLGGGKIPEGNKLLRNEGGFNKERRNFNVYDPSGTYNNAKDKLDEYNKAQAKAKADQLAKNMEIGPDHPETIKKERLEKIHEKTKEEFNNSEPKIKEEKLLKDIDKQKEEIEKQKNTDEMKTLGDANKAKDEYFKKTKDKFEKMTKQLEAEESNIVTTESNIKETQDIVNDLENKKNTVPTTRKEIKKSNGIADQFGNVPPDEEIDVPLTQVEIDTSKKAIQDKINVEKTKKQNLETKLQQSKDTVDTIKNDPNSEFNEMSTKRTDLETKLNKAKTNATAQLAEIKKSEQKLETTRDQVKQNKDSADYKAAEQIVKDAKKMVDDQIENIKKINYTNVESAHTAVVNSSAGGFKKALETISGGHLFAGSRDITKAAKANQLRATLNRMPTPKP